MTERDDQERNLSDARAPRSGAVDHTMTDKPMLPLVYFALAVPVLLSANATSFAQKGPSTPAEWNQMYQACLTGTSQVAEKLGLPPGGAESTCACIKNDLQRIPWSEADAQFPAIRDRCLARARATR